MRSFIVLLVGCLMLTACAPAGEGTGTSTPASSSPYLEDTPTRTLTLLPGLTKLVLPTSTPFIYIVVLGDTLEGIAARYDVSLVDLMAANPGVLPTALIVGMELVIPTSAAPPVELAPTPAPAPVQQARCWQESSGGLWCFALVKNEFAEPLENISAQFTLLTEDDQEVASQTAYAPLNLLPAGASMPLGVHFPPPMDPGLRLRVQVLTATRLLPGDARYLPLMLENTLVSVDLGGRTAQVSGRLMLTVLDGGAETIWVLGVAYDESGTLVGFRRWEAAGALAAGESVDFSFLLSSMGPEIERVEFLTEARP